VAERPFTDAELDAAIESLSEPARLARAQAVVERVAPQLRSVLDEALRSGGWFGQAHEAEMLRAAGQADPEERLSAVRALIAEETRLGMFVGVAVGYELARELGNRDTEEN
jgi:hypothetical protein